MSKFGLLFFWVLFFLVFPIGIYSQEEKDKRAVEEGLSPADKSKVLGTFSKVLDYSLQVQQMVEGLLEKAIEKRDLTAKECLSPLLNQIKQLSTESAELHRVGESLFKSGDFVKVGENIRKAIFIRVALEKLYEKALACLGPSLVEGMAKVIPPKIEWDVEDFALPEPSLEPEKFVSIYL